MSLISQAFLESGDEGEPKLTWDDLDGRSDGLIAFTGGHDGPLGKLMLAGQQKAAEALLDRLQTLFPGRLYVELQRHGLPEQQRSEPAFLKAAYDRDLPLVATNDVFFPSASTTRHTTP